MKTSELKRKEDLHKEKRIEKDSDE